MSTLPKLSLSIVAVAAVVIVFVGHRRYSIPEAPKYLYERMHCSMAWDCYQETVFTMSADIGEQKCDASESDLIVDYFEFTGRRVGAPSENYCETVFVFPAIDRSKPLWNVEIDDSASRFETSTCPDCIGQAKLSASTK